MTLIGFLQEKWKVIALWIGLTTLLSALYAFFAAPVYRSTVVAAPAANEERLPGGALLGEVGSLIGLGQFLPATTDRTFEYLAILESRVFIQSFIQDNKLLPVLYPREYGRNDRDRPTLWEAYEKFTEDILHIAQDPKTALVTVEIDWTDRNQAADWANLLVSRLNEDVRSRVVQEAESNLEFLNKELEQTSVTEIRESIFALTKSQIEKIMLANVRMDYALRVIDPAIAPDEGDVQRPKKLLVMLIGLLLGFFLAMAHAILTSENLLVRQPKTS